MEEVCDGDSGIATCVLVNLRSGNERVNLNENKRVRKELVSLIWEFQLEKKHRERCCKRN